MLAPVESHPTEVRFDCLNDTISGQFFLPDANPCLAIVIHPATGVPQRQYVKFARWLSAEKRAAVLIYDYRGMGSSRQGKLSQVKLCMSDWGVDDQSAALDFLCESFPDLPIWVIGHSLGGVCLPWHKRAGEVSRLVAIASGPANIFRHPWSYMPQVLAFWYLAGPLLTALYGYLPGRMIGLGADLPRNVYWQWRRWCLSRSFYRVDWGGKMPMPDLTRVKADIKLVGINDDVMVTPASVQMLATTYPTAKLRYTEIYPKSFGLEAIGHIGVFSERCKAVWPTLIAEPCDPSEMG